MDMSPLLWGEAPVKFFNELQRQDTSKIRLTKIHIVAALAKFADTPATTPRQRNTEPLFSNDYLTRAAQRPGSPGRRHGTEQRMSTCCAGSGATVSSAAYRPVPETLPL
jgi:hypothetical protein